jgi:uncharacterized membrane-anchored protein
MNEKRFSLWHSVLIVAGMLLVEAGLVFLLNTPAFSIGSILLFALIGAFIIVLLATDVIREVRNADHMLFLLSAVIIEFILFFAFQYWYFSSVLPASYQGLALDPISLLLSSAMIFALNPLYLPINIPAKALMLINSLGALSLVLFVLQNVWQFRAKHSNADHL